MRYARTFLRPSRGSHRGRRTVFARSPIAAVYRRPTVAKSPTLKIISGRIERLRSLNPPTRVVRHVGLRRLSGHGRGRERESVMDEIEISLQAELHQVLDRLNVDSG